MPTLNNCKKIEDFRIDESRPYCEIYHYNSTYTMYNCVQDSGGFGDARRMSIPDKYTELKAEVSFYNNYYMGSD